MPTNNQITEEQRNLIEAYSVQKACEYSMGDIGRCAYNDGFSEGAYFGLSLSSQENEKLKEVMKELVFQLRRPISDRVLKGDMNSLTEAIQAAESLLNNDKTEEK